MAKQINASREEERVEELHQLFGTFNPSKHDSHYIIYIYNIILWMDHQETTYANPTLRKLELPQKEVLVGVNVHHRLGDVGNSYWFAVTGCIEPGGI